MHGLILTLLKKHIINSFDYDKWIELCKAAQLEGKMFVPTDSYPDEDVLAIVEAASQATGIAIPNILESFGEFLVKDLIKIYQHSFNPNWIISLDLLENVENTIHKAVRRKNINATPPQLECKRTSPTEVIINYRSHRKLCHLAKGLIKGIAEHYHEELMVTEPKCMHMGDEECELIINLSR